MKPHVSKVTALFLLSQVFLIITHVPLVRLLAWIIFAGDSNIFTERGAARIAEYSSTTRKKLTSSNIVMVRKRKSIKKEYLLEKRVFLVMGQKVHIRLTPKNLKFFIFLAYCVNYLPLLYIPLAFFNSSPPLKKSYISNILCIKKHHLLIIYTLQFCT